MNKENNSLFLQLTGRQSITDSSKLIEYDQYLLHPEILQSFNKLQDLAKKEIGAELKIVSSFRSFERQQVIWDEKVQGIRKTFDEDNNLIPSNYYSPLDFIKKIMRFSAIPGASRHHWGTDLDIFDASKINLEQVQLTPDECAPSGPCGELHTWLDELIKNNQSMGFFRPYDRDLGGVSVEKWHLSYAPLSQNFYQQYTLDIFKQNIEASSIQYREIILEQPEFFFKQYVQNIVPCPW